MKRRFLAPLAALLSLTACDPAADDEMTTSDDSATASAGTDGPATTTDPSTSGAESTGGGEDDTSGGGDDSSGGGDDSSGGEVGPYAWAELAGPCGGSATNAMWFDDRATGFIGCGENGAGEGLFTTTDGALTWDDNLRFNEVRIMDIRRGPDGTLYGAGIHQLDGYPLWSFDEGGSMIEPSGLYDPSNTTSAVSQAENAAVTADGQMLVDSLTGTAAAYRTAAGEWQELDSLSENILTDPDAISYQVRRIVAHDNQFYAVGSLINDPARIHLPSQMDGATYHFHSVELQPETRDGELLDMHVWDDQHIIVAGHDQSERFPLIYLVDGADPYDAENWEKIELFDSGLDYQAGVNDVHVVGDTVVLVGEKIPTASGGFVVISEDGGRTYEDITPEGAGPLSAVWMFGDGQLVVGGGSGELWAYGPA